MFRFWYHFVPSARTKIAAGAGAQAYAQLVEPGLSHYMGRTFEDIARQYLEECSRRGSLPFEIAEIGRWWGNDPRSQSQCEIDLLATGGSSCLFAECKWTSHPVGLSILWELEAKAMLFPRYQDKYYMLFAKAGFHSELCQHAATRSDVFLIQLPQMFFSKTKNS